MKRHLKIKGVIISTWRIQEYNRGVKIFTSDHGLINTVAYGAFRPKSRLGSLLQTVTYGEFNIYYDPVKKIYRITDYEPYIDFQGIKGNLVKYYSALLWFEIILKSHGGGEAGENMFTLLLDAMNILENCSNEITDRLMIQYILRTVTFFAGPFQLNECSNCGTIYQAGDYVYYSLRDLTFICTDCAGPENTALNPGIKKYIDYSVRQNLVTSLKSGIDRSAQKELKNILYMIIQEYIEDSLVTLKTGKEFLQ